MVTLTSLKAILKIPPQTLIVGIGTKTIVSEYSTITSKT